MTARSGTLSRSATISETSEYGSACSYWARAMRNKGVSHSRSGSLGDVSSSATRRSVRTKGGSARGNAQPVGRRAGELPGGDTHAAPLPNGVEHLEVEPVPAAGARRVEPLRMPEDREAAPVLGRPVQEREDVPLGRSGGETLVPLLGERRVHHRQGHLDEVGRRVSLEIPGAERMGDPSAEAEGIGKTETRVVVEADPLERNEVAM